MKDVNDNQTADLLPIKRPRGRPRTGSALSGAERQAKYRASQANKNVTVTFNREISPRSSCCWPTPTPHSKLIR